mmetsp:Transcript_9884/g.21730  ORF Transcript_9884/g.21730 Transcript_9884/m.21730 type:complete len:204 (+) Transcript_9884:102-713(+)
MRVSMITFAVAQAVFMHRAAPEDQDVFDMVPKQTEAQVMAAARAEEATDRRIAAMRATTESTKAVSAADAIKSLVSARDDIRSQTSAVDSEIEANRDMTMSLNHVRQSLLQGVPQGQDEDIFDAVHAMGQTEEQAAAAARREEAEDARIAAMRAAGGKAVVGDLGAAEKALDAVKSSLRVEQHDDEDWIQANRDMTMELHGHQ